MAIPDARVKACVNLINSQTGGGPIAVFQGLSRYQSGKGFDDFFRGLLRLNLPMAHNVGKSALSAMSDAMKQGASFKDTLRSAVGRATKSAIHGALILFDRAQQ